MENTQNNLQSEETNLKRELGLFDGANILMGIMIGSGIFYIGSYVLIRSGMSLGLALLVWLLGGIVTLISGLCYAELGAMMPKAGGGYVYLREAYGEGLAFTSGFSGFILGSCGSTAGIAVALASSLSGFIPLTNFQIQLFACSVVLLLTVINIRGVKQGKVVQNIFTVGKLIPIAIILFAGLFLGGESVPTTLLTQETVNLPLGEILGMVGFGIVATLWAYEGWTNLNVISEEIKNPKRNIPMAIIISIVFVTVLYVVFNFALYRVVPYEAIVSLIEGGEYYLGTEAANILFGSFGGILVTVCMFLAIFGSLNGCVMVFPRSAFAIAKDGMLPKAFANVHEKYKTPHNAILLHLVITVALIFTRDLGELTALVVFSGMVFKTFTFYSVITLRKKYPDMQRPYRAPTLIVYLAVLVTAALTVNTFFEDTATSIIGLVVPAICFGIYLITKNKRKTN